MNLRGLHGFSHCLQLPLGLLNQPCAAVRRAAEGRRGPRHPRKAVAAHTAAPTEGRHHRRRRSVVATVSSGSTLLASRRTPRRGRPSRRGTHGRPPPRRRRRRGYGLFWLNLACKPVGPLALPQQGSQAARGARRGAALWPF